MRGRKKEASKVIQTCTQVPVLLWSQGADRHRGTSRENGRCVSRGLDGETSGRRDGGGGVSVDVCGFGGGENGEVVVDHMWRQGYGRRGRRGGGVTENVREGLLGVT